MDKTKTTRTLENALLDVDSRPQLDAYLDTLKESPRAGSFREYFFSLDKVAAQDEKELQKKSGIERTYFSHIRSGIKNPGRDKVLRLCIAAGLSEDETRRALESASLPAWYAKDRRDAVIRFAIRKHLSVMDTNLLLDEYGMDALE